MSQIHIPYYLDYLSAEVLARLQEESEAVEQVPGLVVAKGLRALFPDVETTDALEFVVSVYRHIYPALAKVLQQRAIDRAFIDKETQRCVARNVGKDYLSPEYATVVGTTDSGNRIVVGPAAEEVACAPVEVPAFMVGEQVTLFGPPDTAKMSINAMNTLHRRLPEEPEIVGRLVDESGQVPRWGADNEDSKTPIVRNLLAATKNLMGCYDKSLTFKDTTKGKTYELAQEGLALPIKRIPGLALPDGNHLVDGNPIPLHLLDFALHLYHNWRTPQALVFYVPKLENEEEAAYFKEMIQTAESLLSAQFPAFVSGHIRLFIVFESPRSIFRIQEMAQALHPYFLGGSLGWHDFLGSTARLFRYDPHYRIPVKADPNIVINHIRESHHILVDALNPLGAIKIGGMYGILYEEGNPASFEVSMVGFIKDVVTQLKRGLDGFWVAHPNFVRIGIALVQAWRRRELDSGDSALEALITALVPNEVERVPLLAFILRPGVAGLDRSDPRYQRGVLAADISRSSVIANDDPEEVRYNVFQAVQYLADWLGGNGCVALPAAMYNASGERVFVRIMDDLATTERSRWELWAEVYHGRVPVSMFDAILAEEVAFLKADVETPERRIQVHWKGDAARWYPIAVKLLRQMVVDPDPVEFATELLMPFTLDFVRDADDPWSVVQEYSPGKYHA